MNALIQRQLSLRQSRSFWFCSAVCQRGGGANDRPHLDLVDG